MSEAKHGPYGTAGLQAIIQGLRDEVTYLRGELLRLNHPAGLSVLSTAGKIPLTPKQKAMLEALRSFVVENHYPPTMAELARKMGFSGTTGVNDHMRRLQHKGWVVRTPGRARGIQLLP